MRRLWPLFLFITIFVVALVANTFSPEKRIVTTTFPKRVISLAPSVTETVYALGAEQQLIAVTDYCDYPVQATLLPKVGGFNNPSLESIAALNPDLVILLASQNHIIEQLNQLQIPTLAIKNSTLNQIKDSIRLIADKLGYASQGQVLLTTLNNTIQNIETKVRGLAKPKVMISMGHSGNNINFDQLFIAGQHDFYNDIITISGGQNSYQRPVPSVPSISIEGLLQLNPDIIIDIFPESDDHEATIEQIKHYWYNLTQLKAVTNKQIYIIEEDYATIPGPRIFLLLQQIAPLIHPELDWHDSNVNN